MRLASQSLSIAVVLVLTGCGSALHRNFGSTAGLTTPSAAVEATPVSPRPANPKLMVFGGTDHRTYLGCLNCSQYGTDSILNEYGPHGSPYSSESIWNHYGEYGSAYSSNAACNPYSADPPVIVDQAGTYYGRLTTNVYHPQIGIGANYYRWLKQTVCASD